MLCLSLLTPSNSPSLCTLFIYFPKTVFFEFEFSESFQICSFVICMKFSFDLDETSYARIFLLSDSPLSL